MEACVTVSPCPICGGEEFDVLMHNRFGVYLGSQTSTTLEVNTSLCQGCGLVFHNPLPSHEELERYYGLSESDAESPVFSLIPEQLDGKARLDAFRQEMVGYFQRHWGERAPGRLLEMGSNEGHLLYGFREMGWDIQGAELNRRASTMARALFNVPVHDGTIHTLSAAPHSFDAIVSVHVLEHVHDPKETLKGCHHLLHPDGLLYLEVPNLEQIPVSLAGTLFCFEHLYYFTPMSVTNVLHQAGFKVVHLDDNIGYPAIRVIAKPTRDLCAISSDYARAAHLYDNKIQEGDRLIKELGYRLKSWVSNWAREQQRVVVYGAGQHTKNILELADFQQVNVVGLVDGDPQKQGKVFNGYQVFRPQDMLDLRPDAILISSYAHQNEIADSLRAKFPAESIFTLYDHVFELEEYAYQIQSKSEQTRR